MMTTESDSSSPYSLRRRMVYCADAPMNEYTSTTFIRDVKLTQTKIGQPLPQQNGASGVSPQNGASVVSPRYGVTVVSPQNGTNIVTGATGDTFEEINTGCDDDDFDEGNDEQALISEVWSDEIETKVEEGTETSLSIAMQVFIPYIIAGFGTVAAGMVLDAVQYTPVFQNISEIFILVPSLLGLKGNLEMTLASRLSTQANIGTMDNRKEKFKMIGGNLILTQAQAIVVGFLASLAAMIMGWIPEGKFDVHHGMLLCASSVLTASVASFLLGLVMVGVVLLSRKCNTNPDNIATPIAASLGDFITLVLLYCFSLLFYMAIDTQAWIAPCVIALFSILTPVWVYYARKNTYTSDVIYTGWTPIISAMTISSIGGLILDFVLSSNKFAGIAVFQPVINGVGGNLVAVQASRLSTALHKVSKPGTMPSGALVGCPNPLLTFCGKAIDSKATRILLLMVIPGHLVFMFTISSLNSCHSISLLFAVVYLSAAVLQVVILLYTCRWMISLMWKQGDDPDNFAIPYLTALGDLLGTAFLAIAFYIIWTAGQGQSCDTNVIET